MTDVKIPDPLPCPFCGDTRPRLQVQAVPGGAFFWMGCGGSGGCCEGPKVWGRNEGLQASERTKAEAMEAWNQRA